MTAIFGAVLYIAMSSLILHSSLSAPPKDVSSMITPICFGLNRCFNILNSFLARVLLCHVWLLSSSGRRLNFRELYLGNIELWTLVRVRWYAAVWICCRCSGLVNMFINLIEIYRMANSVGYLKPVS